MSPWMVVAKRTGEEDERKKMSEGERERAQQAGWLLWILESLSLSLSLFSSSAISTL